ncbi:phage/plasmid primase, P4 family, partial [Niallia alba]|uniref:DNA primase family protein n=1 Tax=Niallia alba TaxID=2729105 RepID=UPI00399F07E7
KDFASPEPSKLSLNTIGSLLKSDIKFSNHENNEEIDYHKLLKKKNLVIQKDSNINGLNEIGESFTQNVLLQQQEIPDNTKDFASPEPSKLSLNTIGSLLKSDIKLSNHENNEEIDYHKLLKKKNLVIQKDSNTNGLNEIGESFTQNVLLQQQEIPDNIKLKKIKPKNQKKEYKGNIPNYKLAEILMKNHIFSIIESNLYYWNDSLGYYVGLTGDNADIFIRKYIPDEYKKLITFKSCQEIIQWIKSSDDIKVNDDLLIKRKSLVAFSNCIINIKNLKIHRHSPKYYITSVINADFPVENIPKGNQFEAFMNQITGGNKFIYKRLQELFGYVISEIRDVKAIPYLLGPKDSGKSIILKLLEHLVGQDFFTNLSFEELNQPNFLCQLFGKKLNACGETSEIALNRLDNFKKLSGGDYVMARFLYGQAFKFINKSVLLFAGNHLPTIKGIDKSNAFSQRLVIFPFKYPVPKEKQDIHLLDRLLEEIQYIAYWSLIGLKRWSENNYIFTTCSEIEVIAKEYSEQTNSVISFIQNFCTLDPEIKTHNDILELAYKKYCRSIGIPEESNKTFHKYLKSIKGLKYSRFRLNGENKYGYIGIGTKE